MGQKTAVFSVGKGDLSAAKTVQLLKNNPEREGVRYLYIRDFSRFNPLSERKITTENLVSWAVKHLSDAGLFVTLLYVSGNNFSISYSNGGKTAKWFAEDLLIGAKVRKFKLENGNGPLLREQNATQLIIDLANEAIGFFGKEPGDKVKNEIIGAWNYNLNYRWCMPISVEKDVVGKAMGDVSSGTRGAKLISKMQGEEFIKMNSALIREIQEGLVFIDQPSSTLIVRMGSEIKTQNGKILPGTPEIWADLIRDGLRCPW
jgi:hypothetical protein